MSMLPKEARSFAL